MQPGNTVATLPNGYATGLEDFDVSDLKLPRLSINHETGTFKDSLSNMESPVLEIIPLGAIKQRVLWHPAVSEDKDVVPLCKSTDHSTGYPTMDQPDAQKNFPWQAAQWNPSDFPTNAEGRTTLPCNSCRLKDWGSHPLDGKKTWCSEQHAIPLLYAFEGSEPGMTALFTAQRSSINASKAFFASIMRRQLPAFGVRAKLSLTPQKRGKNTYYVPVFMERGLTDQAQWPVYSDSLTSIRNFISQPPRLKSESTVNTQTLGQQNQMGNVVNAQQFSDNTWAPGASVQQPTQQYAQPAPPVQQATTGRDNVQQYVQPAPPVAPMPPPAVQYAPPVQQAPPVVAQPMGSTPARDADDDLPF